MTVTSTTVTPAATDAPPTPGAGIDASRAPGHWLLARMGKRVLRPGGLAMTRSIVDRLSIGPTDDVVELAPGLGLTTALVVDRRPATYVGVERDEDAARTVAAVIEGRTSYRCRVGTALDTGLDDASASVVFGEAFLTMQSDEHKRAMIAEAFRIARSGARYGLHEMCLRPDSLSSAEQDRVRGELARSIRVGARPLTVAGWRELVEEAGFRVVDEWTAPMALLRPRRLVADEGVARAVRIAANVARDRDARRRVLAMRATFRRNADHLGALGLVAVKP